MLTNDPLLIEELRRDEGVRYMPYLDTVGIQTVGVGHNLQTCPLYLAYPLTDSMVDDILAIDLKAVFVGLDDNLSWWRTLSYARQRVLANMAFNMGIAGLLTFKNTLAAIERGAYVTAAAGMLHSKWARQVKGRANRLAQMMIEG